MVNLFCLLTRGVDIFAVVLEGECYQQGVGQEMPRPIKGLLERLRCVHAGFPFCIANHLGHQLLAWTNV
jgi:hypothetical protein